MGWQWPARIEVGPDVLAKPLGCCWIRCGPTDDCAQRSDFESATGVAEGLLELEIAKDFAAKGAWGAGDVLGRELEGCSTRDQCADFTLFDFVQHTGTAEFGAGGFVDKIAGGLVVCH